MKLELSHDLLAKAVHSKVVGSRKGLSISHKYLQMAMNSGHLLSEVDLEFLKPDLGSMELDGNEVAFIAKSRRGAWIKQAKFVGVIVGVLLFVGSLICIDYLLTKPLVEMASIEFKNDSLLNYVEFCPGAKLGAIIQSYDDSSTGKRFNGHDDGKANVFLMVPTPFGVKNCFPGQLIVKLSDGTFDVKDNDEYGE